MVRQKTLMLAILAVCLIVAGFASAEQTGTPFNGHTNPARFKAVDYGGGTIYETLVVDGAIMSTNILYMIGGILPARTGIGVHTHTNIEEMYFVFDGPAEFTVDDETSLLPAGSSVLCPIGSSHALYNPSDETVRFLRIATSKVKGVGDEPIAYGPVPRRRGVSAGATLIDTDLAKTRFADPPTFRWARFDRTLCRWVGPAHDGANLILNRRPWIDGNFETFWVRVGHCILPPGSSIGYHRHNDMEEVYYIMGGTGRGTVNDVTFAVKPGNAFPCTENDSHGVYNNGTEDLDLFVFMVSMQKENGNATNHGDDLSDR